MYNKSITAKKFFRETVLRKGWTPANLVTHYNPPWTTVLLTPHIIQECWNLMTTVNVMLGLQHLQAPT